jgi:hypothetical protein
MSQSPVDMPDDPTALKAMIAALQSENAKMSATLRAHDLLVQASCQRRASSATHPDRQAQEAEIRHQFRKDRVRDRTARTGARRSDGRHGGV